MTSYGIMAMLSKYLGQSSKKVECLKPFYLEGGGQYIIYNCNRTYIYDTVHICKISVHLRCLCFTQRDSQSQFVEYGNTTTASATFTRNRIKLISSWNQLIYGELSNVSSEPRFSKC